jgi:hypothetical protein
MSLRRTQSLADCTVKRVAAAPSLARQLRWGERFSSNGRRTGGGQQHGRSGRAIGFSASARDVRFPIDSPRERTRLRTSFLREAVMDVRTCLDGR